MSLDEPRISDGAAVWRVVRDSAVLDVNSPYSYLLWCRDFAATSVVARAPGGIAGLVTGYRRPQATDTLLVWQVAVDSAYRRQGLARSMLDHLVDRVGCRYVEATVTTDNTPSARLFTSLAADRRVPVSRDVLFDTSMFPGGQHESEVMFRIGPLHP